MKYSSNCDSQLGSEWDYATGSLSPSAAISGSPTSSSVALVARGKPLGVAVASLLQSKRG